MNHRRLTAVLLSISALALVPASAQAKQHRVVRKLNGVVRSLDVAHHTMVVSVGKGRHHRLMTVNISGARMTGNHGAVAVGDHVKVTCDGSGDASKVLVIGVPNGGDGGKGAALGGVISAIDASSGTFTLSISDDSSGDGTASSVVVEVNSSTILAVTDVNGDGSVGLDDLSVGDRAVVFTADATADPVLALGVLDGDHIGRNHHDHGEHHHGKPLTGQVTSVDSAGSTITMLVPPDELQPGSEHDGFPTPGPNWQQVTVLVNDSTHFGGDDVNGDGQVGLDDVQSGDVISVVPAGPIGSDMTLTALGVCDRGQPPQELNHFRGDVTAVDPSAGAVTVSVTDGSGEGQSVTIAVTPQTKLYVADTDGDGQSTVSDFEVGDRVGAGFSGQVSSQVTALILYDMSNPPSSPF